MHEDCEQPGNAGGDKGSRPRHDGIARADVGLEEEVDDIKSLRHGSEGNEGNDDDQHAVVRIEDASCDDRCDAGYDVVELSN